MDRPSVDRPSVDRVSLDRVSTARMSLDRVSAPLFPDVGEPRESRIVGTFLRDSSLQYTKIPFAGPGWFRVVSQVVGFVLGVVLVVVPLVRQIGLEGFSYYSLLPIAGLVLCLELLSLLRSTMPELWDRLFFRFVFRTVELGLERAVPQAGTTLRYEVHLAARRKVSLESLQVRLVFWESWRGRDRLRFLRIPHSTIEKRGHDLVRQVTSSVHLDKGQQAVIRGTIKIPAARPSEHHRTKHKHMSYVNLTITLQSAPTRGSEGVRGNCPQLVTFPWI
ncbi:MAG: hypothetical protein FWD57_11820 [Polyangiaceae bacterium]|nr:hypothetical protein [Polyangiaceae bacterium]